MAAFGLLDASISIAFLIVVVLLVVYLLHPRVACFKYSPWIALLSGGLALLVFILIPSSPQKTSIEKGAPLLSTDPDRPFFHHGGDGLAERPSNVSVHGAEAVGCCDPTGDAGDLNSFIVGAAADNDKHQ
jgi:hypothetical protein